MHEQQAGQTAQLCCPLLFLVYAQGTPTTLQGSIHEHKSQSDAQHTFLVHGGHSYSYNVISPWLVNVQSVSENDSEMEIY